MPDDPRATADHAIAILAATPSTLPALLSALPPELTRRAGEDDEWAAVDILGHLVSIEELALRSRIEALLDANDAELPNIDGVAALEQLRHRGLTLTELLATYAAERARTLAVVRSLRDDQLGRAGRQSIVGRVTVLNVLCHFAFHDLVHTAQIATAIGRSPRAGRGNLSAFE